MGNRQDDADLIHQYATTQDPTVRDEIILRYVPLVHYMLGRLGLSQAMGADYEDAASQGLLGLIEAVDRFDTSYGTQFSTYATLRIRGKVIDHLRSLDWLSRGARKRARQVQNGVSELWEKLHRMPTDAELAEHLDLKITKVQQALLDNSRIFVSLDSLVPGSGDEEASLHELLPDESQAEPSESLEEVELNKELIEAIRSLPQREQLILSLYYHDELTFREIGEVLDISESRVCQLHGRIMVNLRAMMTSLQRSQPVPPAQRRKKYRHQEPYRVHNNPGLAHDQSLPLPYEAHKEFVTAV